MEVFCCALVNLKYNTSEAGIIQINMDSQQLEGYRDRLAIVKKSFDIAAKQKELQHLAAQSENY